MAFPIPSHLPRRATPQDVSSKILNKIDQATYKTLDAKLASSWVDELDETIQTTKQRLHDRIQTDLLTFQRQFQSSKSVQERLHNLTTNVDTLNDRVSNPKTGLIPTLVSTLTKHAALAQESLNADVKYVLLSHLLKCQTEYLALTSFVDAGRLPEAVEACASLEHVVNGAPAPLQETVIMMDLKRKFSATKSLIEEQLSDACTRGVVVSPKELVIQPMIQVRQSQSVLSLPSVLASLSPNSLTNHLNTLRRDLTTYFIEHVFKQPTSLTIRSSPSELKITLTPAPPNSEMPSTRLQNLSEILDFLSTNLFPNLPPSQTQAFTQSLCKPVSASILNSLLVPSLPQSIDLLPPFLDLLRQSVEFEQKYIVELLGRGNNDTAIKSWADNVSSHYERQRRVKILEESRLTILVPEDIYDTFQAEVELPLESAQPTVVPFQEEDTVIEEETDFKDDAWGFDDDAGKGVATEEVEDSWGFGDEMDVESEAELNVAPEPEITPVGALPETEAVNGDDEPDPADAWGWNDDTDLPPEEELPEESAWDDPWAEPTSSNPEPDYPIAPSPLITSPKAATRLEKLASKNKKHLNGSSTSSLPPSPLPPSQCTASPISHPPSSAPAPAPPKVIEHRHHKRPSNVTTAFIPKESYLVSTRMKRIVRMVEDVLTESKQFINAKLLPETSSGSTPGTIILQSASSILDLYRALYPVVFGKELESPERAMMLSNNCLYLSEEVKRIKYSAPQTDSLPQRLSICHHHLKILGDSWFDDTIERQRQAVDKILVEGTQGFTYSGDQDRFDECESAIGQVLQDTRRFAHSLKGILAKSKYYTAVGLVVDAALSRVLEDVLALPDIPEMESHHLSELCRILNAFEGLFSEDPSEPSFVVAYVPSWLKFSYLSELLEASMADITYLFEEGALVDFDLEELVRLVKALFADTALRTTTINKILGGHPA
ncbi:hypothetical protein BDQ12DRAFT_681284 [Crucibulum laeve]|uniref:ZW10 C-terminal helical domain-containing protein n=1 Tax=Crucibulum laeve TaxID=68775 RepID=A0A5C3M522_9AGAR|nr:hypothetical protein BDQ12DRAFT_681284 [Crucibulum laeve]